MAARQHASGALDFTFKSTVEGLQVLRDLGTKLAPKPRNQPEPLKISDRTKS